MNENPLLEWIWTFLASFAGALTALSFRPFEKMKRGEIVISLTVGASFAIFVGPWVAWKIFGDGQVDTRILGAVFYLLASGSNVLIPLMVRRISGGIAGAEK